MNRPSESRLAHSTAFGERCITPARSRVWLTPLVLCLFACEGTPQAASDFDSAEVESAGDVDQAESTDASAAETDPAAGSACPSEFPDDVERNPESPNDVAGDACEVEGIESFNELCPWQPTVCRCTDGRQCCRYESGSLCPPG